MRLISAPAPPEPLHTRLLVVEDGARDIGFWLANASGQQSETIVVRQNPGEAAGGLVRRVLYRAASLLHEGKTLDCALIVMADLDDPRAMVARRLITHGLLASLAVNEFAELKLVVDHASTQLRELLLDLVGSLVSDPAALRVSVRLHFGSIPPRRRASGIQARVREEPSRKPYSA